MCPDKENTNLLSFCSDEFPENPKTLSALSLAFIGDAVYETMIRRMILTRKP